MKYTYTEIKATRDAFGDAMFELGNTSPDIVALTADLTESLKLGKFKEAFPKRFIQCGIAESNMIGIAAGLAVGGKIPFTSTFANFSTSRVYDQIRQSVAYSQKNVKICASHAGLTLGEDGATHQVLEDIGMMKMLPGMIVINPCDYNQTYEATIAISKINSPVYLRFGRPAVPNFTEKGSFKIGKGIKMIEGSDITIIATGHMVWKAIEAQSELEKDGISAEVINIHTIKPLDEDMILESVGKTGLCVVAEEHQISGGLGESVASLLSRKLPTKMDIVGVKDTFGESGKPDQLMEKYGLTSQEIINKCKKLIEEKPQINQMKMYLN